MKVGKKIEVSPMRLGIFLSICLCAQACVQYADIGDANFSCFYPPYGCPPGFTCKAGWCVNEEGGTDGGNNTDGFEQESPIDDNTVVYPMSVYGVVFGFSDDFEELAGLGVMNPLTVVYQGSYQTDIDRVVNVARMLRNNGYP